MLWACGGGVGEMSVGYFVVCGCGELDEVWVLPVGDVNRSMLVLY